MDLQVAGCGCGSYWLGRCGVRRNLWLQVWYLICSYVGGGILCGVGQSDIFFLSFSLFSLFFGIYRRGVFLVVCLQGFAMRACAQAWRNCLLWEREQECEMWTTFVMCASVSIYLRWWVIGTYMEMVIQCPPSDEISTSPRGLGIIYKTLLAENCQELKMAAIGRNMQFFLANKHHHLIIFYSCVF